GGGWALEPRAVEAEDAPCGLDLQPCGARQRLVEVLGRHAPAGLLEQQDRLGGGRGEPRKLAEDERDLVSRIEQGALHHVDLHAGNERQRDRGLLETAFAGEAVDLVLPEPAGLVQRLDPRARGRVVARDLAGLAADAADDVAEHSLQRRARRGVFRGEPAAYRGGGLLQQLQ